MNDHARLLLLARQLRELAAVTLPEAGSCDWGDCIGVAEGYRWSDDHGWLPVCRDHQEPVMPR